MDEKYAIIEKFTSSYHNWTKSMKSEHDNDTCDLCLESRWLASSLWEPHMRQKKDTRYAFVSLPALCHAPTDMSSAAASPLRSISTVHQGSTHSRKL